MSPDRHKTLGHWSKAWHFFHFFHFFLEASQALCCSPNFPHRPGLPTRHRSCPVVPMGGKKRRLAEAGLEDGEGSLQTSFVTAANATSTLFTLAVQQTKRARVEGAADILVSPVTL